MATNKEQALKAIGEMMDAAESWHVEITTQPVVIVNGLKTSLEKGSLLSVLAPAAKIVVEFEYPETKSDPPPQMKLDIADRSMEAIQEGESHRIQEVIDDTEGN